MGHEDSGGLAHADLFGAFGLLLCVLCKLVFASFDDSSLRSTSTLSGDEIVQKLVAANARRAERLRGYRGRRLYKLDYRGAAHDATCSWLVSPDTL